jgi:glycosyltransferase involved in cell wall biosynthesis
MPDPFPKPYLSVVVPLFKEIENLPNLVAKLEQACQKIGKPYELVLVDDGSPDGTAEALREMAKIHPTLHPVYLRRNYGQSAALTAGFDTAQGEFIATLDGDLQNDPEDIPAMLKMAEKDEGDVICGWRQNRQDGAVNRKLPSLVANWLIRRLTKVRMHDYGCSMRVFRTEFAKGLTLYGELHRFIPVLVAQMGARLKEVPVRHHAREKGQSKYGIGRLPRVVLDLILMAFFQKFATRPIQFFGGWGLFFGTLGSLAIIYLVALKLFTGVDIGGRPMLILGALGVLLGVIMVSIGLCAELLVRVYYEATGKKIYTTKNKP